MTLQITPEQITPFAVPGPAASRPVRTLVALGDSTCVGLGDPLPGAGGAGSRCCCGMCSAPPSW